MRSHLSLSLTDAEVMRWTIPLREEEEVLLHLLLGEQKHHQSA